MRRPVPAPMFDHAADGFVTVEYAALVIGRPERTIREWMRLGAVAVRRDGERVLVDVRAAAKVSATRGRRRRGPTSPARA